MERLLSLENLGWCEYFSDQLNQEGAEKLQPARVIAIHKGACDVSDGTIVRPAKMTGKLRHQVSARIDYPTVGDWVLVQSFYDGEFGRLESVLKRKTLLKRKVAGRTSREQSIASNIDTAFIVQGLGKNFNLNRLERYLVMVNESSIDPVLILTKTDLLNENDLDTIRAQVSKRFPGVLFYMMSNKTDEGLEEVRSLFKAKKTYCVIGISGVGKSTLLNSLLGEEVLFTLPVRKSDGKGMHSTSWRELITLKNGAHVIDTPGMRELGNLEADAGIQETFVDIHKISQDCQYKDCTHIETEGCAVKDAVDTGKLSSERYEHYVLLSKESQKQNKDAVDKLSKDRKSARFHRSLKFNQSKNTDQ